ncbi:MAG: hypothetical protein U9P42_01040 [Candidatus Fermentibacteria bacterium]|nr:hypothetical protein [Candidatus Fermentibacteria bacterium]
MYRLRLIFATVLTALVFFSCSFFEPRVPEDPSNAGVVWLSPTSPDIVVENMRSALNGRSALYLDCLTESFVFYADTNDINNYPSYNFSDWTKTVENSTVTALYSQVPVDSTVTSEFTMDISHPDPAAPTDSATIYRLYSITIPQTFHSGTGSPAVGIAEFHMVEDSVGLWAVQEWRDVRHEETSWATWAVAKAYYR